MTTQHEIQLRAWYQALLHWHSDAIDWHRLAINWSHQRGFPHAPPTLPAATQLRLDQPGSHLVTDPAPPTRRTANAQRVYSRASARPFPPTHRPAHPQNRWVPRVPTRVLRHTFCQRAAPARHHPQEDITQ
jgi:hypothetical protein